MRGLEGLREKLDAAHRSCADLREALHLEEVGGEGDLEEALREAAEVHEKIVALLEGRAGCPYASRYEKEGQRHDIVHQQNGEPDPGPESAPSCSDEPEWEELGDLLPIPHQDLHCPAIEEALDLWIDLKKRESLVAW